MHDNWKTGGSALAVTDRMFASAALALGLRRQLPQSQFCIVSDGRRGRAALLVSQVGPCWLDMDGLHDAETMAERLRPAIRIAGRRELQEMVRGHVRDPEEAIALVLSQNPQLQDAVATAAALPGKPALNMDGLDNEGGWTCQHPDSPDGGSPGWQTLDTISEYAGALLEFDEDGADWFEQLSAPEQVQTFYTQSDCDDFAVALHRITGWPLVRASFPDSEVGLGHHTLVQGPDGRLLDAAGWHTAAEVERTLGGKGVWFSQPGGEEVARSSNIGEASGVAEDGTDTALAMAVSAIRQLPWAPFGEPGFHALAVEPLAGVDVPAQEAGADVHPAP